MTSTRTVFVADADLRHRPDLLLGAADQDAVEIVAVDGLAAVSESSRNRTVAAVVLGADALVKSAGALIQLRQAQPLAALVAVVASDELEITAPALNARVVDLVLPRGASESAVRTLLKHALLLFDQRRLERLGLVTAQALARLTDQPATALSVMARELRVLAAEIDLLAEAKHALSIEAPPPSAPAPHAGTRDERQHTRLPLIVDVRLDGDDLVMMGVSENLSVGGMFVACQTEFPIAARLRLTFRLPTLGKPVRCEADVVWRRPGRDGPTTLRQRPGLGLRFVALPDQVHDAIDTLARAWDEEGDAQLERLTL